MVYKNFAACWFNQPVNHFQHGSFAAAARANNGNYPPLINTKRNIFQYDLIFLFF
jgi:hypothetical protein